MKRILTIAVTAMFLSAGYSQADFYQDVELNAPEKPFYPDVKASNIDSYALGVLEKSGYKMVDEAELSRPTIVHQDKEVTIKTVEVCSFSSKAVEPVKPKVKAKKKSKSVKKAVQPASAVSSACAK
jgi:hypothetical protein